jgi:hypothetical protein
MVRTTASQVYLELSQSENTRIYFARLEAIPIASVHVTNLHQRPSVNTPPEIYGRRNSIIFAKKDILINEKL